MGLTLDIKKKETATKIPEYLIYEILDGKPLYYKGYKNVLNKTQNLEDIMGSSSLQAELVTYLLRVIMSFIDWKVYNVHTSEPGLHIDNRNNLAGDILIYERSIQTPDKINTKYSTVPAFIHIEIDISADLEDLEDLEYLSKKVNKLFAFGTKKIFWIFTMARKVLVATPGNDWVWINWGKDVEIMNGHHFNIGSYLKNEGITLQGNVE